MAKHNWKELKKKYLLGDYKTLKEFADNESLNYGYLRKNAIGWDEEKGTKQEQKENKIIEKTIEKIAEKEADRNARILTLADRLADKIEQAIEQIEQCMVTNKKKTKTVEYDTKVLKPTKEVTTEEEVLQIVDGLIDKQGLKTLTAALRDIKEITTIKETGKDEGELESSFEKQFEEVIDT